MRQKVSPQLTSPPSARAVFYWLADRLLRKKGPKSASFRAFGGDLVMTKQDAAAHRKLHNLHWQAHHCTTREEAQVILRKVHKAHAKLERVAAPLHRSI